MLSDEWRAELSDGLEHIVDGVPKTDIVGIERELPIDGDCAKDLNKA